MSTFGDDAAGRTGRAWGAGIVGVRSEKSGLGEVMGEVCFHEGRGDFSTEAGGDVMSVGGGRLRRSWRGAVGGSSTIFPSIRKGVSGCLRNRCPGGMC